MTERLARRVVAGLGSSVGLWLIVILAAFVLVGMFLAFEGEAEITRTTESKQADRILYEGFPQEAGPARRSARSSSYGPRAATSQRRDACASRCARGRAPGGRCDRVVTYDEERRLVSQDGDSTVLLVALGRDGEEDVDGVVAAVQRLDDEPGYRAAMTGELTADADEDAASLEDLKKGELFFGVPLALVVLLLVFGAVVAGLVPLMLAIVSIVVALALVALLAQAYDLSVFTQNMLIGMGLALGIDYSLFTLSRYREERLQGREKPDAIATAGATAGRAVLFSGIAFVLAMLGLLLVPSTIFRSLAAGAILVGIVSVFAALTLLPAVLALLGDRVNALRIPFFGRATEQAGREGRFWGAIVYRVMRRPVASLVLAAGLLLALAAPVLALDTGTSGPATLPDRFESKQGYLLLRRSFRRRPPSRSRSPSPETFSGSAVKARWRGSSRSSRVARSSESRPSRRTRRALSPASRFRSRGIRMASGRSRRSASYAAMASRARSPGSTRRCTWAATRPRSSTTTTPSTSGFRSCSVRARAELPPAHARLPLDRRARDGDRHEPALGRSRLRAARARLPRGNRQRALGLREAETIDAWVPLFLFAVLFGLSMDYQVSCSAASASATGRRATPTLPSPSASARPRGSSPARR